MVINSTPFVHLDYTKKPEDLVTELINVDNGTSLSSNQIVFGIPELSEGTHNSKVVVSAAEDSYFTGSVQLSYNRVDIGDIPNGRSTVFLTTTEQYISDLIAAIDERYNLKLTPLDYVNALLPTIGNVPNEEDSFDLVAANTSLVFINKLTLQIERAGGLLLSNVLRNILLNGLVYNPPVLHDLLVY
jgi:hypothetical protein